MPKLLIKKFDCFPICRISSAIICKCQSGQKSELADSRTEILELGQKDLYIDKTESLARYYVTKSTNSTKIKLQNLFMMTSDDLGWPQMTPDDLKKWNSKEICLHGYHFNPNSILFNNFDFLVTPNDLRWPQVTPTMTPTITLPLNRGS